MIKGLIGSLIAAAVFFAAGGISVAVIGLSDEYEEINETADVEWRSGTIADERISGSKTWNFEENDKLSEISINTSSFKTRIEPSEDGKMSVSVSTNKYKSADVEISYDGDGIDISLSGSRFFGFISFGIGSVGTAVISVPDNIYEELSIDLGSGSLDARGIRADKSSLEIGSGSFKLSMPEDFTARELEVDIGSGSVTIDNAAAKYYEVEMGSGSFDISGLTGSGSIDIGSGSGTARFAEINGTQNDIDMGSGSLKVYIPSDTKADLYTDIGSGSVTLDCCGVKEKLTNGNDGHYPLNGGYGGGHGHDHDDRSGSINVDMGSGHISFFDLEPAAIQQVTIES